MGSRLLGHLRCCHGETAPCLALRRWRWRRSRSQTSARWSAGCKRARFLLRGVKSRGIKWGDKNNKSQRMSLGSKPSSHHSRVWVFALGNWAAPRRWGSVQPHIHIPQKLCGTPEQAAAGREDSGEQEYGAGNRYDEFAGVVLPPNCPTVPAQLLWELFLHASLDRGHCQVLLHQIHALVHVYLWMEKHTQLTYVCIKGNTRDPPMGRRVKTGLQWRSVTLQLLVPLWCSEASYREQPFLICQIPVMGWGIVPLLRQRRCFLWPCPSQPRSLHNPPPHIYTVHIHRTWISERLDKKHLWLKRMTESFSYITGDSH